MNETWHVMFYHAVHASTNFLSTRHAGIGERTMLQVLDINSIVDNSELIYLVRADF